MQRKFMRHIVSFLSSMDQVPAPRLFVIDFEKGKAILSLIDFVKPNLPVIVIVIYNKYKSSGVSCLIIIIKTVLLVHYRIYIPICI